MISNGLEILYEDNHIIVVYKKANILSQSDSTKDLDLLTMIKQYVKEKYQKPGNVFIGLIHRLDRPVSGVMVYARTSKAASRLSKQVRNCSLEKQYFAVVNGILPEKKGEFCDFLEKLESGNTVVTDGSCGKKSILSYEVLEEKNDLSLVRIFLKTGRHHQIRVQFASRGFPLFGDQRYGKSDRKQIALTCFHLSFFHPVTKERLLFERFPDFTGVWMNFNCLKK
ncbi:MAG: RluA family pseudouridine synthase [Bacilli bacterium]|nr:RluA family pseudouridine synthase [Bacilli bacterium]